MADYDSKESYGSKASRLLATGLVAGGFGYAGYRGLRDTGNVWKRLSSGKAMMDVVDVTNRASIIKVNPLLPPGSSFKTEWLEKTFKALDTVTSPAGREEMLRNVYDTALYAAGLVSDADRGRIVGQMISAGTGWDEAKVALARYEKEFGGLEGVYKAFRTTVGGWKRGYRGQSVAHILQNQGSGGYSQADFEPQGRFWDERRTLDLRRTSTPWRITNAERNVTDIAEILSRESGVSFTAGVRSVSRHPSLSGRRFHADRMGMFKMNIPGSPRGGQDLQFAEFQVGGRGSRTFLQAPITTVSVPWKHKALNIIASDHRGMGYSSVPHLALPTGGGTGYAVLKYDEAVPLLMRGSSGVVKTKDIFGRAVELDPVWGLAQELHKHHGNKKAASDAVQACNTAIRGTWQQVTGSSASMRQGYFHSQSVLPGNILMDMAFGRRAKRIEMDEAIGFATQMRGSGYKVFASSEDAMAQHLRMQLGDPAAEMEIFGGMGMGYPAERKFLARSKDISMTRRAMKAAGRNKIFGTLSRTRGLTLTKTGAEVFGDMPMAFALYTLDEISDVRPEEALITSRMSRMMEMENITHRRVRPGSVQAKFDRFLEAGEVIGIDYDTGETILAEERYGLKQMIRGGPTGNADVVNLEIRNVMPGQDSFKGYGPKDQYRLLQEAEFRQRLYRKAKGGAEEGLLAKSAAKSFHRDIEMVANIDALKGVPAEIQKQMSEALWITSWNRMNTLSRGVSKKAMATKIAGLPRLAQMHRFIENERARKSTLKGLLRRGKAWSKKSQSFLAGLQKAHGFKTPITPEMWEHIGVGLETLKKAKTWGISDEHIGLIGGAFWRGLVKTVDGNEAAAGKILAKAGLGKNVVAALKGTKEVLGLPTIYIGSYASQYERFGRGTVDPRMLEQIKAQGLGEAGELLLQDLFERTKYSNQREGPALRTALESMMGQGTLPEGVREISTRREAREALGREAFVFKHGDKSMFIPGPENISMTQMTNEVGSIMDRPLRGAYDRYFRALQHVTDADTDAAKAGLKIAEDELRNTLADEFFTAISPHGDAPGSAQLVARSWLGKAGSDTSRTFSQIDDFMKSQEAFVIGMTKGAFDRQYRDLVNKVPEAEKAFLMKQREAFMRGEDIAGFIWRHPITRVQSGVMAKYRMIEGPGEFVDFRRMWLKEAGETFDVSLAAGMKLDTDMDHLTTMLIRDEKTSSAIMKTLNDTRYKREFVNLVRGQHMLQKEMKAVTGRLVSAGKVDEAYIEGLKRLIGVKLETGAISNLVGEMRSAVAFAGSERDFKLAGLVLQELEEGPIGSKLGKYAGDVRGLLEDFVRPGVERGIAGKELKASLMEAYEKVIEKKHIDAGEYKFNAEEFVENMSRHVGHAEERGWMAAKRDLWERVNKASKGGELVEYTEEQILRAMKMLDSNGGDVNANLVRAMRLNVGSEVIRQREAINFAGEVGSALLGGLKKHWKYPAIGLGAALAISTIFGGQDLQMPDDSDKATQLGMGSSSPAVPPPPPITNRIVTAGGGQMPMGYNTRVYGDFSSRGLSDFMDFAGQMGGIVTMRDNRRGISPQDVQKQLEERYI